MEVRAEVLVLIVACLAVTIIPRVVPLLFVRHVRLPPVVHAWLRFVPTAVISALLFTEIVLVDGAPSLLSASLIAGAVALIAASLSRSIAATIVIGVASFATLFQCGL